MNELSTLLPRVVGELSDAGSLQGMFHEHDYRNPLPSAAVLYEIVALVRSLVFPGYYGDATVTKTSLAYHTGLGVERLHSLLANQVAAGLCFAGNASGDDDATPTADRASQTALRFIGQLPDIRRTLATDVEATYLGDPAAESYGEVIACYPVTKALVNYRMAHSLHLLGVPLIPRMLTEMAHSETGIDIHPAASIGHHFTIDHGTGVVIGATTVIGNHVKLYQGVTLGAKNFPLDENGAPVKGIDRHPIIEDRVIVYSNATLLGRITIGHDAVIGANVWVTSDVPPGTTVSCLRIS